MNIFTKLGTALLLSGVLFSSASYAQDEVGQLIKSSPADATKLVGAYISPLFKGFGASLNSGWTNTGNAKNLGRFDLRIVSVSGALIPSKDKSFDLTKIELSNNVRPIGSTTITPTVAGNGKSGATLGVYAPNSNTEIDRINLPGGIGLPFIPSAQLQATVGLPKGIDVTLRGVPNIKLSSELGEISMLGGGIKIEPLRLIAKKGAKLLPVDIGLALGYTRFNYEKSLKVEKPNDADLASGQTEKDYSTQKIDAQISSFNIEAIVSKKLLFFIPFASVGYNTSTTEAGLLGNYPVVTGANLLGRKQYSVFTDPVTINQKYINNVKATAGFQLNLAVVRFYASYSVSDYQTFNAGLGFGLGK